MKIKTIHIAGWCLLLSMCSWLGLSAQLPLKLPDLLSDHAVLQKNATVKLWGRGPGSFELKIVASWNPSDTIRLQIGAECSWATSVQTPAEKGPHSIIFICGNETKKISDILLGDVWLCAGQSNMEYNYDWGINRGDSNYRVEENSEIRFFEVEKNYDDIPVSECRGKWVTCDPASASKFSTVGYFFGRGVNENTHTPVGLIGAYWGGTNIQAWMPIEAMQDVSTRQQGSYIEPYGWAPKGIASLFNAMIYPLHRYRIKGCIWYQGEANVDWEWNSYGELLTSLAKSWRNLFETPFYFYAVQVAPWNGYKRLRAAALREQIENASQSIPRYGSIAIQDLVPDTANIHPDRKREVGLRLSDLVLKEVYGQSAFQPYPPYIVKVDFKNRSALAFYNAGADLRTKGAVIAGFELAGADSVFYPAKARLLRNNKIEVTSSGVAKPVALRYCFTNTAVPNLFDKTGLPLKQFRTDHYIIY